MATQKTIRMLEHVLCALCITLLGGLASIGVKKELVSPSPYK